MPLNALNWFEIPVSDFDRAKKFYSTIFNFEMPEMQMGPQRMGILLYDAAGGGIGGAIVQAEDYRPVEGGVLVYLNANPDLQNVLDRVEQAGGKIAKTKTFIAEQIGYEAMIIDSEGNRLALHSNA